MTKTLIFLLTLSFGMVRAQSQLDSHNFQFKGYSVSINDEITDEAGNHILIGSAKIAANYAKDRDARLDALYKLSDYAIDNDSKGLIIIADDAYKIIKLDGLHSSFKKILWDSNNKCYWIGGSSPHYHKDFSYQVSLTRLNPNKEIVGTTAVETEGNTYFQDMVLKDKNLILLGMKMQGKIGESEFIPAVMEINPAKSHDSKKFVIPRKVPDIIHYTETDYPKMYRFDFSPLFIRDGFAYFGIGNAIDKGYGIHFYRYKDGKAEYVNEFGNIDSYHSPYLIGFLPTAENNFLLAYAAYFSRKLTIARTDIFLQPSFEKQTKLSSYPDFNSILELPNGKLAVLTVGENDFWSYLIFDANGELLKEVGTSISEKLHPSLFKIVKGNTILSSFFRSGQDEPTVLQILTVD
jgi:hypothetical protein